MNNMPLHTHQDASAGCRADRPSSRVAILLCTYNGEEFLAEQLESILAQTHQDWVLFVSDDGSTDRTLDLLEMYRPRLRPERLVVFSGPKRGFAQNFLSLIRRPEVQADFFAFCDQDDIWFADKLERSVAAAQGAAPDRPFLYCSRTRLVNGDGEVIGFSPLFSRCPSFHNALVQSLAGANTMLFNQAALALVARVDEQATVISHDWLAYIVVSGCGGQVVYDPQPTLDYRQHGGNLIGSNNGMADRMVRVRKLLAGTFRDWNRHNLRSIRRARPLFTSENRYVLSRFVLARRSGLAKRLRLIHAAGLYRQTLLGNIGLVVATGMRKF